MWNATLTLPFPPSPLLLSTVNGIVFIGFLFSFSFLLPQECAGHETPFAASTVAGMPRSFVYSRPKVSPEETLLDFLVKRFAYLTAEGWRDHLASGYVSVNSAAVLHGDGVLKQHDIIVFSPPRSLEPPVDEVNIQLLHEDADLVVCAKNGDLPVTEGGRYSENTLVGVLNRRWCQERQPERAADGPCNSEEEENPCKRKRNERRTAPATHYYAVHRLDKETSGLVVLAKSSAVANTLRQVFESQSNDLLNALERKGRCQGVNGIDDDDDDVDALLSRKTGDGVSKSYVAILSGVAQEGAVYVVKNRIGPIAEHPFLKESPEHRRLSRLKMTCAPLTDTTGGPDGERTFGKAALSKVTVLRASREAMLSLARVDILTGRSHQIRLHCAEVGFPVLGDKLYTTARPGCRGHGYAVDDAVYLARVRATDPETGHTAFSRDPLQPQWECRRHCLHAAALRFTHPTDPGRSMVFSAPPAEWFLRDIRPSAADTGEPAASTASMVEALGQLLEGYP